MSSYTPGSKKPKSFRPPPSSRRPDATQISAGYSDQQTIEEEELVLASEPPPFKTRMPPSVYPSSSTSMALSASRLPPLPADNEDLQLASTAAISPQGDHQNTYLQKDNKATFLQRDYQNTLLVRDNTLPSVLRASMKSAEESKVQPFRQPAIKSILTTMQDIRMASRQSLYPLMRPGEQAEQDKWVQEYIKKAGPCPEGYDWVRKSSGYQCKQGGHGMTDEIIMEGKGGLFACKDYDWEGREGPYYPVPNQPGKFFRYKA